MHRGFLCVRPLYHDTAPSSVTLRLRILQPLVGSLLVPRMYLTLKYFRLVQLGMHGDVGRCKVWRGI